MEGMMSRTEERKSRFVWNNDDAAVIRPQIEAQRAARDMECEGYYYSVAEEATPAGKLVYYESDESWHLDGKPITRAEAVAALALAEAKPAD
jgi:hypothetical protein